MIYRKGYEVEPSEVASNLLQLYAMRQKLEEFKKLADERYSGNTCDCCCSEEDNRNFEYHLNKAKIEASLWIKHHKDHLRTVERRSKRKKK